MRGPAVQQLQPSTVQPQTPLGHLLHELHGQSPSTAQVAAVQRSAIGDHVDHVLLKGLAKKPQRLLPFAAGGQSRDDQVPGGAVDVTGPFREAAQGQGPGEVLNPISGGKTTRIFGFIRSGKKIRCFFKLQYPEKTPQTWLLEFLFWDLCDRGLERQHQEPVL